MNYEQIQKCQTEGLTNHGNTVRDIRARLDSLKSQLLVVRGTAERNKALIGLFAVKITAAEMALDCLQKMTQPMYEEIMRTA